MIRRQESASILIAAIVLLVIYLPLHLKYVTMSDLGSLIAALLLAGSILFWGFRKRIELLLRGPKESIRKKEEQELLLLISPLYAKLNKNDEIIYFMTTYKISRLNTYDKSSIDELGQLETEIKEIMLQYLPLASDQLYNLINKFLELRPDWEQSNTFEAKKTLREIKKVVKERQDELRTEFKQP